MARHTLQLNFPESSNESIFLIDDISIYDGTQIGVSGTTSVIPPIPIVYPNLQITCPGFDIPTLLLLIPNFHLVLNACTIGLLSKSSCGECCPNIPDGLYNIRYSVVPTDQVFVEYKVLRITHALNRYYKLLCKINIQPCLPDKDMIYQLQQLDIIHNYLIAAKKTVEIVHEFEQGVNLYKFAVELIDKMSFEPNRFC